MRLIDADALLEFFKNNSNGDCAEWFLETIEDVIKDAPTIQREGWKLVPIEPTEEMLEAVLNGTPYVDDNKQLMREAYKSMLAAAPTDTE